MRTEPISVQWNHSSWELNRLICYHSKPQISNLCVSSHRPLIIHSKCCESTLKRNVYMIVYSFFPPRCPKDSINELQDHNYCNSLAQTSMIVIHNHCFCNWSVFSIQGKNSASKAQIPENLHLQVWLLSGVVSKSESFHHGATKYLTKSVRQSTNICLWYGTKWLIFPD